MKGQSKAKSADHTGMTYSEAVEELELILDEIEKGEIDIDVLSEKVKRALTLVKSCKTKLKNTEDEVARIMEEFDEGEEGED